MNTIIFELTSAHALCMIACSNNTTHVEIIKLGDFKIQFNILPNSNYILISINLIFAVSSVLPTSSAHLLNVGM